MEQGTVMNLGALLVMLKLVDDMGFTVSPKTEPHPPQKITLDLPTLKDIPTVGKELGRPGLKPKGL